MDYAKLREDLARDEGRRLTAYTDTNGYWTIGVGHLLGANARMTTITDAECDALLQWDIGVAEAVAVEVLPNWTGDGHGFMLLDDVRQRALVNMAFNRGRRHMLESTTIVPAIRFAWHVLSLDRDAAWRKVAEAIKASPWAQQVGKRAERLAYMFETGKDPQ